MKLYPKEFRICINYIICAFKTNRRLTKKNKNK